MIRLGNFIEGIKESIDIQNETQVYLHYKLPEYNYNPNVISDIIQAIYDDALLDEELTEAAWMIYNWILNNKCAIDDEFVEIMEALGGKYKKSVWKHWKADNKKVAKMKFDDIFSGSEDSKYYDNLKEEIIDLYHFILNLLVIIPKEKRKDILDSILNEEINTKEDFDQMNAIDMNNYAKYFMLIKNIIDNRISRILISLFGLFENQNLIDVRIRLKEILDFYINNCLPDVLISFVEMWGSIIPEKDFNEIINVYKSKNEVNRNRWSNGY